MKLTTTLLALAGGALLTLMAQADDTMVHKGEYLARAADCVACHTVPGGKPFAGGVEFKLPFGSLFSPNITPDKETGIGAWTDDEFVDALQKGVGRDGKHYYPAFPYTSYTKMSRDEILAIKAYLGSLEPVRQAPPENDLGFPFNQRWGMVFWNLLFLDEQRFQADSQHSEEWNRGKYLVEGPGHCGECHSPRNLFQAVSSDRSLAGNLIQGWNAYNISSDPTHGIGAWPTDVLARYLKEGAAAGWGVAAGPMAEVVEHSLSHLSDADRQAIAVYLKGTPARGEGVARPQQLRVAEHGTENPLGHKLFADACASCHRLDGAGNQSPSATLLGLKTVNDPAASNLLGMLLNDHGSAAGVNRRMPAFGRIYGDQELAALSTFLLQRFGESGAQVSAQAVATRRTESLH
ncbi:TPA: cytochrome c [Pseudomonas aeruginosa]|uniref:cytochrome c n=1 Tax=Pseudomonas citronellolis TaxID=53408 RepID=UPI001A23CA1A|nr:cytochrome c [Pseudomonas citronellolis]MBH3547429.1 cytochrome c [Pseudomonas aeruginosa]UUC47456.1 cytochrome c [Pseudomonas citronellolis]HBN9703309.1 cytochrome c [Pseudomonas aeruginosa]HBN9721857.1 cytochrome c [Pseudomonas aeruginosa]HBN9767936.1 cytochrome c [Pseudomonas aeruginosa]